jgi:hypothetical protein
MIEKELYPGHAEELRKREELKGRIERAHSAVLPGALREAFSAEPARAFINDPQKAGGQTEYPLQPVTLGLTANLERIKSPLLDMVRIMREVFSHGSTESRPTNNDEEISTEHRLNLVKQKVSELKFEEADASVAIAETVFVFTQPQKRVRKLLDAGRDKLREAAMEELGDRLHPTQMAALQRACSQHYVASFATIIGYGVPPPEGEGHAVSFRPPSPSEATGSVGG